MKSFTRICEKKIWLIFCAVGGKISFNFRTYGLNYVQGWYFNEIASLMNSRLHTATQLLPNLPQDIQDILQNKNLNYTVYMLYIIDEKHW